MTDATITPSAESSAPSNSASIRAYDEAVDADAVIRIWRETRWIDTSDEQAAACRRFFAGSDDAVDADVGVIDGTAECAVLRTEGTMDLGADVSVPLCAITAVTTSHIGRKRGLASALTARALHAGAEDGAAIAALGMFEQGFYDRFGFGTGAYAHDVVFDPTALRVADVPYRTPVRLTPDDGAEMHAALNARQRNHGAVRLHSAEQFAAALSFEEHPFALGYRDDDGRLTHFLMGNLAGENGPFRVLFLAYRNGAELLELLRLLRELGDQVHTVRMAEPPGIQLQALLDQPIRHRSRTTDTAHANRFDALAWWQARVLDLAACAPAVRWYGTPVEFRLELDDPIERFLDDGPGWSGLGGTYAVRVGDPSTIERIDGASTDGSATLHCSVNAFTRLWLGASPASGLALTDGVEAPAELLTALDRAIPLADPQPGLYF